MACTASATVANSCTDGINKIGPADYIGCMKNGDVYSDAKYRWFERLWPLLGKTYFTHAWGTLYVVSGKAATALASMPSGSLRFFTNEGALIIQMEHACTACVTRVLTEML